MLPKQARLTQEKDFSLVYKKGRRVSSHNLRLFFLKTPRNFNRFGFVISKKAIAHSTGRNRVKRKLRAAIWQERHQLKTAYDIIIQGLSGSASVSPHALCEELLKLFEKVP